MNERARALSVERCHDHVHLILKDDEGRPIGEIVLSRTVVQALTEDLAGWLKRSQGDTIGQPQGRA